jgi:hypothetical protein
LAFYALVRFVRDLDRQEPVNVGVVVTRGAEIQAHFAIDRVDDESAEVIRRFEELLRHLIDERERQGEMDGPAFLAELAFRRFSHFQITEPRQATCSNGLDSLLTELSEWLHISPEGVPAFA